MTELTWEFMQGEFPVLGEMVRILPMRTCKPGPHDRIALTDCQSSLMAENGPLRTDLWNCFNVIDVFRLTHVHRHRMRSEGMTG